MVLLFFTWIYFTILFICYGHAASTLITGFLKKQKNEVSLFYYPWIGISAISYISSISSLFVPINTKFHLIITIIAIIYSYFKFNEVKKTYVEIFNKIKSLKIISKILISILLTIILFIATDGPVYNLDPGRYHFQNLLWAKTYPVVPGLSNLHDRFGNSSTWYLIHAFADVFIWSERSYHIFNSLIFFYIIIYGIISIDNILNHKCTYKNVFISVIFIFFLYYFNYIYYWYLSCLTPDLPVNVFAVVCMLLFIDLLNQPDKTNKDYLFGYCLYGLISSQAFAIRISAIYLLLPILYYTLCIVRTANKNKYVIIFGLPFILILPTLIRNTILTGYILYPFYYINLFEVDWKTPSHIVKEFLWAITTTGFMKGLKYDEIDAIQRLHEVPHHVLVGKWVLNQIIHGGFFYWLIAGLTCLLISLFQYTKQTKMRIREYQHLILFSLVIVFSWIYSSPEFRFGFGYVGISFALLMGIFLTVVCDRYPILKKNIGAFFALLTCIFVLNSIITSTSISLRENKILYPYEIVKYVIINSKPFNLLKVPQASHKSVLLNNNTYVNIALPDTSYLRYGRNHGYIPNFFNVKTIDSEGNLIDESMARHNAFVGTMNWMNPLPSVGALYQGTEMRGNSLRNGFRIREKEERKVF